MKQWLLWTLFAVLMLGGMAVAESPEQDKFFMDIEQDSSLMLVDSTQGINSACKMKEWFNQSYIDLCKKNPRQRIFPISAQSTHGLDIGADYREHRLGVHYDYPLNTINVSYTFLTLSRFYLSGSLGGGVQDAVNLDSEVEWSLGLNAEYLFGRYNKYWNPLIGIGYTVFRMDSDKNSINNQLYFGNHFYVFPKDNISLFFKGGLALWQDTKSDPPGYYLSGGLAMKQGISYVKAGAPLLGKPEISLQQAMEERTLNVTVYQPIRIYEGLSVAPSVFYGANVENDMDNLESATVYGAGVDVRLFCDMLKSRPSLNPYLGIRWHWFEYEGIEDRGSGYDIHFGSRFKLNDYFSIDGSLGPAFWKDNFPQEDPGMWNFHIGLTAVLGKPQKPLQLKGKLYTKQYQADEVIPINEVYEPLKDDASLYDAEARVYGLQPATVVTYNKNSQYFGNLSGVKYFKVDLMEWRYLKVEDLGEMGDLTVADFIKKVQMSLDTVTVVALFDKNHVRVDNLKKPSTQLLCHFMDFDSNKFFGYRVDPNNHLQPEPNNIENVRLRSNVAGVQYMGQYDDFVKPMTWITDVELKQEILEIVGKQFEEKAQKDKRIFDDDIMSAVDRYDIAMVKYHKDLIVDRINASYASDDVNYGMTVMAVNNLSGRLYEEYQGKKVGYAAGNDYVFTNPEKLLKLAEMTADSISADDRIDSFDLCDSKLKSTQKKKLNTIAQYVKDNPELKVTLFGIADGTAPTDECQKKYEGRDPDTEIAKERAEAVQKYLIEECEIDSSKINLESPKKRKMKGPRNRAVMIKYE